jgi:hypothetical protein
MHGGGIIRQQGTKHVIAGCRASPKVWRILPGQLAFESNGHRG